MPERKHLPEGFNLFPREWVGYWQSEDQPDLPHPRDFVDPTWDEEERAKVVAYLDDAYYVRGAMGYSWCRMGCPETLDGLREMGNKDFTDGLWVFPEGLVHYVKKHSVKPDPSFLEHIRKNEYKIPVLVPRVKPERRNCELLDRITTHLKDAMKAHEALRVAALRMVLSGAQYARIEKQDNLTDEEVVQILRNEIQKRLEAVEQYQLGNRLDLADKETDEAAILRAYLPESTS